MFDPVLWEVPRLVQLVTVLIQHAQAIDRKKRVRILPVLWAFEFVHLQSWNWTELTPEHRQGNEFDVFQRDRDNVGRVQRVVKVFRRHVFHGGS